MATDWNFATGNMVWVSKRVKLFFYHYYYFSVTDKRATPLINYGGFGKKLSAKRFQGPFLGGQALIAIDPWLSKDDHWLITAYVGYKHDPKFVCPKACVMSSPIAISKLKYFGFGFRTSNCSTLNSKIKSTKGKIVDNVKLKYFRFVYTFSASVSSLFVPPSTVLAIASLIFLYSSP